MKWKGLVYGILGCAVLMSAVWKPAPVPANFTHNLTLEDKKLQVSARVYSAEESEHILNVAILLHDRRNLIFDRARVFSRSPRG